MLLTGIVEQESRKPRIRTVYSGITSTAFEAGYDPEAGIFDKTHTPMDDKEHIFGYAPRGLVQFHGSALKSAAITASRKAYHNGGTPHVFSFNLDLTEYPQALTYPVRGSAIVKVHMSRISVDKLFVYNDGNAFFEMLSLIIPGWDYVKEIEKPKVPI